MVGGGPKLPADTEEAKALAEVSAERFNRYQKAFVPLENQYISDVMNTRQEGAYEDVGGLASAQYADQYGQAGNQLTSELEQQGVDPSSGVFVGQSTALRKAQAMKQSQGVSSAKVANTDRFYSGLGGLIAMGQGQAGESIGGLSSLAEKANTSAINDAASSYSSASGMRAGVGSFAGLAAAPYVDKAISSATGTSKKATV